MPKKFLILFFVNFLNLFGQAELQFTHERGFYYEPFELTVTTDINDAQIKYTLNGSNPFTSGNAISSSSPLNLSINPDDFSNRDKAPGVILKVCVVKNDTLLSEIVTHTYLFPEKITELSPDNEVPGDGWLIPGSSDQQISYGLDPDIINNPAYSNEIVNSFLSIPTVSLTTDLKNLFDPDSGIYVNAFNHGEVWEREASLELLYPDGTEGFQINCGVRVRGGWSRYPHNPKHAFRIFFRSEYGEGKLHYPLYGDEGADEYNKIDIQTAQNYSWSFYGDNQNTFLRELFARDTQRDMGQPYTRGKFCHLYLNGTYWGLFQLQERAEASYGETYFGGNREDYDVVKVNVGQLNQQEIYEIEATDGTLDKWYELWLAGNEGFDSDELFFKVQGLNTDGTKNNDYDKLVDLNNLIDYMIGIFFTGDIDAPISVFRGNNNPNNFFAVYNRVNPDGFKFFRHDAEHSLFEVNENRTGPYPAGQDFVDSNPQWLHQKLSANKHYRLYFADRVYKHFFNNGVLIPGKNIDRLLVRKNEIESAIIAESARWGDSKTSNPRTKADWQNAVNYIINDYFPNRNQYVLNQLKGKQLFSDINPPQFNQNGGLVEKGFQVTLTAEEGTIYYTTDGADPYSPFETSGISLSALTYANPVTIERTSVIKARLLTDEGWSPLNENKFIVAEDLTNLRITELHYHPADFDTINDTEYEFIELKNIGTTDLDLTASSFITGIEYTYPQTILSPGNFIVLASNTNEFLRRYEFSPYGEFEGQLNNSGELIVFINAVGDTIFSFTYDDNSPWPKEADGDGYSLVVKDLSADPNSPAYWQLSSKLHGSPGSDDPVTSISENPVIIPYQHKLEQNFPNPFNPHTKIKFTIGSNQSDDVEKINATLIIYDILGNEVATLMNEEKSPGNYEIIFDTSLLELSSGIYFYQLTAGNFIATRKMILLR